MESVNLLDPGFNSKWSCRHDVRPRIEVVPPIKTRNAVFIPFINEVHILSPNIVIKHQSAHIVAQTQNMRIPAVPIRRQFDRTKVIFRPSDPLLFVESADRMAALRLFDVAKVPANEMEAVLHGDAAQLFVRFEVHQMIIIIVDQLFVTVQLRQIHSADGSRWEGHSVSRR